MASTLQQFMQSQTTIDNQTSQTINDIRNNLTKLNTTLSMQEKGKFSSQPQPNPQVQIAAIESSSSSEANVRTCKAVITLRSGKEVETLGNEAGKKGSKMDSLWPLKFEDLPIQSTHQQPSDEVPPSPILKPLPESLKYVFLGLTNTFPCIISSSLSVEQEKQLLWVLKQHKVALRWSIADIKGISPTICTHRIFLEENSSPTQEMQMRLNPTMKEVVKNEVLKLLDVGIIYSI
ncbi:hypothetical protein I3760_12G022700 [Carya illinoinensis]|nr:hypothetical protein I3760_12G022700 [Carya illinoinensis]KAG2675789.1 hypothetical protein I3760_12G022700 [Carya illinoinensis]KAG2675790.1 hypothetical protein I3760_12G022700 [Carya illinoinensis]